MRITLISLMMLTLLGCSAAELQRIGYAPLTEAEVTQALKDALSRGIARSAANAARVDGYLGNPRLRIELPEDAARLEKTLRKIGFGDQVDKARVQLNRAAERAAARAKPVFISAITGITIDDAFDILNGEANAATQYLIDVAGDDLYDAFRPIIVDALDETSATRYYDDIVRRYNALPLVFDVDPELADYVTEKAIEGLFLLMAQEEARIRTQSSARTTRLMKRVFGSLD